MSSCTSRQREGQPASGRTPYNIPDLIVSLLLLIMLCAACTPRMFEDLSARALKDKIDSGEKMVVIDLRTQPEYLEGHVPGARNVPPGKLTSLRETLPPDKDTLVVFYCSGLG